MYSKFKNFPKSQTPFSSIVEYWLNCRPIINHKYQIGDYILVLGGKYDKITNVYQIISIKDNLIIGKRQQITEDGKLKELDEIIEKEIEDTMKIIIEKINDDNIIFNRNLNLIEWESEIIGLISQSKLKNINNISTKNIYEILNSEIYELSLTESRIQFL